MEKSNTTWVAGLLVVAILVSAMATMTIVTKSTGFATEKEGTTDATVTETAVIVMIQDAIDFGPIDVGDTLVASDDAQWFTVKNMGNVNVDISVQSEALWTKAPATSDKYRFKCYTGGTGSCPGSSITDFTNMPIGPATLVVDALSSTAPDDDADIDIEITAPVDEPAGLKDAIVTFTASAS